MASRLIVPLLCIAALATGCGSEQVERASATSDPAELLRTTVDNLGEMRSATVDLKLRADTRGALRLQGPFSTDGTGRLPKFAFDASLESQGRSLTAGATWTGEDGYLALQGTPYEVSPLVMGQVVARYEQALKDGEGGGLLLDGIDFSKWLGDARNDGPARVGDAETIKLSGRPDVPRVLADIDTLSERAAALSLPGVGGMVPGRLTPLQRKRAAKAGQAMRITVYTGAADRILRRLVVAADSVLFDVTFTKVGKDQAIAAPSGARPFGELLETFDAAGVGEMGSALGGSLEREPDKRVAPNRVDEYAACLEQADGDRAKGRKCASLLTG